MLWYHAQVRYVGVSNETSYGVAEFIHAAKTAGLPRIQTIQNCECGELCWWHPEPLVAPHTL
jgi:hypothetical protein